MRCVRTRRELAMRVVIIGAGPAGLTVAETLRAHDHAARSPCSRRSRTRRTRRRPWPTTSSPAASRPCSGRAATSASASASISPRTTVTARRSRRAPGRARRRQRRSPTTRLVIASGSRLYAPVEGASSPASPTSSLCGRRPQLVERVRRGEARSAVIVGAGFIGVEVALLLRELGLSVTWSRRSIA